MDQHNRFLRRCTSWELHLRKRPAFYIRFLAKEILHSA